MAGLNQNLCQNEHRVAEPISTPISSRLEQTVFSELQEFCQAVRRLSQDGIQPPWILANCGGLLICVLGCRLGARGSRCNIVVESQS